MRHLFTSLSICAMALTQATTAAAQDTRPSSRATDESAPIQDIVITATRSATNLQDTPIAITAVTSETLQERSITSTADLSGLVPNATFRQTQGAFGRSLSAFIRGIGQGDGSLASEPGVAFYVDDSYYPLVLGSIFDLLDLDHVEVLRGPQGTLFGRNALAGAVNLVSKEPNASESSGYAELDDGRVQPPRRARRLQRAARRRPGAARVVRHQEPTRLPEAARLPLRDDPARHAGARGKFPVPRRARYRACETTTPTAASSATTAARRPTPDARR